MSNTDGRGMRRRGSMALVGAATLVLAACGGGEPAADTAPPAAEVEYAGDKLTFVVPFGPGGDYDFLAREAAPLLEEELGVNVVVENQPGAGGLVAWNNLYQREGDVEVIAWATGQGLVGNVVAEQDGIQFDIDKFTWLGRASADPRILATGANGRLKTAADLLTADAVTLGTSGPGSSSFIDGAVLFGGVGVKGQPVTGFSTDSEIWLAVAQNNLDLTAGPLSVNIRPVQDGSQRMLLAMTEERIPEYPDVPAVMEFDLTEEQKTVISSHIKASQLGRLVIAPPGVPAEQAAILEAALTKVWSSPEMAQKLAQRSSEKLAPISGADALKIADEVLASPAAYKDLLKQALADG